MRYHMTKRRQRLVEQVEIPLIYRYPPQLSCNNYSHHESKKIAQLSYVRQSMLHLQALLVKHAIDTW